MAIVEFKDVTPAFYGKELRQDHCCRYPRSEYCKDTDVVIRVKNSKIVTVRRRSIND